MYFSSGIKRVSTALTAAPLLLGFQILLDLLVGILTAGLPILVALTYSKVLGFQSARGDLLPGGLSKPSTLLPALSGIILLQLLLIYARQRNRAILLEGAIHRIRTQLLQHHADVHPGVYVSGGTGKFMLRITGDLGSIRRWIDKGVLGCFSDLVMLLLVSGLAVYMHPGMFLSWLAAWGLLGWGQYRLNRKLKPQEKQRRARLSNLVAEVSRILPAVATIQTFNRRSAVKKRLQRRSEQLEQLSISLVRWTAPQEVVAWCAGYVPLLLTLYFLWYYVPEPGVDAGLWLGLIVLLLIIRPVMRRLMRAPAVWVKGLISIRKMEEVLRLPKTAAVVSAGEVVLEDYLAEAPFLLELTSKEGAAIAMNPGVHWIPEDLYPISASDMIAGMAGLKPIPPSMLLINGMDAGQLPARTLRKFTGFASHSLPLYGQTLLEALCGKNPAFTETIFKEWQLRFPVLNGLDLCMRLKDIGLQFNAVQLQLLQLIRLQSGDKRLWLLQEPFSALDSYSEETALRLLSRTWDGKTVLIVGERQEGLKKMQKISDQAR